ncbi:P-loop containing nucleoside triphosphate hydrolase protein [Hortaea werneckii]|uniref:ATPase AAA-type core domain-containing protein n=1 Tax=Hortaea werneckii TaxID=91943 RepID=A0A3M7BPN4_HORWE|nr:P-loop containing nucleoside triphosphate hydrolase protein [Hortaea werneckii]KAI7015695.1 P-loop containing nucleoside triphosphate hydrolase protein [Hortaea werneckii]KAI7669805.1 P-loop containing nucleoside triphosphate hydrolase protein [Hortaea werneckii]RMY25793.1 hypothetical protein D0867_00483 [Hortaea werneckii]RMY41606.1 hypothetical protein D0866_00486 [Hortaea werneckii]
MEPFTLIEEKSAPGPHHLFDDVLGLTSAPTADHDLQYIARLREANPGMIVTAIPANNVPLRAFAAAGLATCDRDTETDSFASLRGYTAPPLRQNKGQVAEAISFAKYWYNWSNESFILYLVGDMQYVLKEIRGSEHVHGPSKMTDALIQTIGDWLLSDQEVVWVYDLYWSRSKELYKQVQKASWDKVILDEKQKADLTKVATKFFSSKDVYEDLGVPWKRGLLFHGPPGNGKTISITALMHTLLQRDEPIPTLYVKNAPMTYDIRSVFAQARRLSPCMLVLEDIETIVTSETRSYFFNELDGLENNDGLFVVGSTNFLDRLDPGLSKRPSRFDRKYLFPLPNEHERTLYCEYWRHKLEKKPDVEFPRKLSPAMANITSGFSFAFLQECFVATLLTLARGETGLAEKDDDEDLDKYELWGLFKQQADALRKEITDQTAFESSMHPGWSDDVTLATEGKAPVATSSTSSTRNHPQSANNSGRSTALPDLRRPAIRDELLPQLPYAYQKRAFINSAAIEERLP